MLAQVRKENKLWTSVILLDNCFECVSAVVLGAILFDPLGLQCGTVRHRAYSNSLYAHQLQSARITPIIVGSPKNETK